MQAANSELAWSYSHTKPYPGSLSVTAPRSLETATVCHLDVRSYARVLIWFFKKLNRTLSWALIYTLFSLHVIVCKQYLYT